MMLLGSIDVDLKSKENRAPKNIWKATLVNDPGNLWEVVDTEEVFALVSTSNEIFSGVGIRIFFQNLLQA